MRKLSLGIVALAGAMAVLLSGTTKATGVADTTSTASPLVKHLEYVVADGALYVSNLGFGPPPSLPDGPGQVLRIRLDN